MLQRFPIYFIVLSVLWLLVTFLMHSRMLVVYVSHKATKKLL